ncbi:MAG: hypothetical protein HFG20_11925 [Anaerotruncus sp.]|nr:hypothetical protein [Anaerotruncus sp.]
MPRRARVSRQASSEELLEFWTGAKTPAHLRGWFMEGDALLPLHEVRRDERG